jgi:HEAT repeat protein
MLWPILLRLKSRDPEVRIKAVESLADMEGERAFEALVKTAEEDQDQGVKSAAIIGIGQFTEEAATAFLLQKLQDTRAETRQAAIEALRDKMEEGVRVALVTVLRDADAAVRGRAAQVLTRQHWRPKDANEELWHAIARGGFVEAISSYGARAIEPLEMILQTGDTPMKVAVIRALAEIEEDRVIDILLPCLKSSDEAVCVAAIEVLSELGTPKLSEPLMSLLKHSGHKVRVAGIEAVVRLQLQEAAQAVSAMLKDRNWDVRTAAAVALGKMGNRLATESLVAAIKDSDADVRQAAITSLGQLGDPAAIRPLVAMLADADSNVRHAAGTALPAIDPKWPQTEGARQMAPELRAACDSSDPAIRFLAVNVLQRMGESSIPEIVSKTPTAMAATGHKQRLMFSVFTELLADADRDLRLAAVQVLGRLGDPRALESLKAGLADTDESVQRAAAKSLELLQTKQKEAE